MTTDITDPVPTDTGKMYGPTREDFERNRFGTAVYEFVRAIDTVTGVNNRYHIGNLGWTVIFVAWLASAIGLNWFIMISVARTYGDLGLTFDTGAITFMVEMASFLIYPVFMLYLVLFIIMAVREYAMNRQG